MAHPQHNFTSNFNGSDGHNAELTLNINGVEKKYTPAGNDQTYNVPGVARIDINLDGADLVQAIQAALDGAAQPLLVERSIYDEEVAYPYIGDLDGAWYFGICTTNKIVTIAVAKEDGAVNGEQIPVANGVVIVESDSLNRYSRLRTALALGQLPVLSYVGANPVYAQYEKTADNGDLIFVGALASASDTYVQYNIYTVASNNTVTVTTRAASAGGGGTPDDENGFFNSSLYQTPGDGVTESLTLNDFRIKQGTSIHGSNIEFVPTHQEGGIDFGEVYLNPGTYILNIRYTLQWVGNPRGTFAPLVCNVGGQPFDFSFEQENTVITSQIRVVTARQKVAISFPFDADTPPMGIWVETLSIAQIASNTHPAVVHDTTLAGSGTAGSPLGVTTDAFGKIKDIPTSISQFRTGDVIPVDGPNGPAKMPKADLLTETAQNALAGNVAPAFDPTKPNDADGFSYYIGESVIHDGKIYRFTENHISGQWNSSEVKRIDYTGVIPKNNLIGNIKFVYGFMADNGYYVERNDHLMGALSVSDCGNGTLDFFAAKLGLSSYGLRFAFVKSFNPVNGDPLDFCEGTRIIVLAPGQKSLQNIIPDDCNYVIAWAYSSGGVAYPFGDSGVFFNSVYKENWNSQELDILPEVFYNSSLNSRHEIVSRDNAYVLAYKIKDYNRLYINYLNTFIDAEGFVYAFFADGNKNYLKPFLSVAEPVDGVYKHQRVYDKFVTGIPTNAEYLIIGCYDTDSVPSIGLVTTMPVWNTKVLREIQPVRHDGYFFRQNTWDFVSNWYCNSFEYDVSNENYVFIDNSAQFSGGPYPMVFRLADDSYFPVYTYQSYTKYGCPTMVPVPPNAVKLIINNTTVKDKKYYLPKVCAFDVSGKKCDYTINEFVNRKHEAIDILFIGNSLTQDAVSYLPLLLREVCPDIEFNIYMWYNGGYTLKNQWENNIDPSVNNPCAIFSICHTKDSWVNANSVVTMLYIFNRFHFDYVCLQEYFNYVSSYTAADTVYFNNIVNYIAKNVGFKFEVDCLFHAPKRGSDFETIYERTKNGNVTILKNTPAVDIFVPGCAVYEACKTALDSLGDMGHLSPDGTHTQEGLPCLLQAYVMLLQILNKIGRPMTIEGVTSIVDANNYSSINVPGPNLGSGVVAGTSSDYEIAKQVAASSCNKRFAVLSETF